MQREPDATCDAAEEQSGKEQCTPSLSPRQLKDLRGEVLEICQHLRMTMYISLLHACNNAPRISTSLTMPKHQYTHTRTAQTTASPRRAQDACFSTHHV